MENTDCLNIGDFTLEEVCFSAGRAADTKRNTVNVETDTSSNSDRYESVHPITEADLENRK